MTLSRFVSEHFFPRYVAQLKPSVQGPHRYNWQKHLEPLCGETRMRYFRTCDGQRIIEELAKRNLSRNTLKRLKSLLSGIFSEAMRQGVLDGVNSMREVRIPKVNVRPPAQAQAYTLREIQRMLLVLPEPARTIVAALAYTGMRKGEVEELRWEHWHARMLWVEQSSWRGHFTEPKSPKSKAPIPVIPTLARFLQSFRHGCTDGLIFKSRRGTPLNLDNLAKRVVRPALEKAGIEWRGWHAFRRGLATNLKQIGIDDKTIQAILRHADYSTTMNNYVQSVPESIQKAMEQYERLVCTKYAPRPEVKVA